MQGKFITLEGPEGSGKSTQAQRLAERLTEQGIDVFCTREPGGTVLGEEIRAILQHSRAGEEPCERTELLLFEACRSQLVERVIRPRLDQGVWVICDRFMDSTTAYQGYGRGLPLDEIEPLHTFAVNGILPDLTLLLDLDIAAAFERLAHRCIERGEQADRFEREERAFHERVRAGYLQLAEENPDRFRRINAAQDPDAVANDIQEAVKTFFGRRI